MPFRQVPELMKECALSAKEYARDAQLLLQNESNPHAFALVLLGNEELAKALYLWKRYVSERDAYFRHQIELESPLDIPGEFFGRATRPHIYKLSELLKLVAWGKIQQKKMYEALLGKNKVKWKAQKFKEILNFYKKLAKNGNDWRKRCMYVDFDDQREVVLKKECPVDVKQFIRRLSRQGEDLELIANFFKEQLPQLPEIRRKLNKKEKLGK